MLGKYRAGFSECLSEVSRFLSTCEGVNAEVRSRLLGHLAGCLSQINALNYPAPQPPAPTTPHGGSFGQPLAQIPTATAAPPTTAGGLPCKLGASAAEGPKVYGGFHLVPAADGQFAFLVPNASFAPHGGAVIPLYANGGPGSSGLPPAAVSPSAPSLPTDSVWRPW